MAARFYSLSEVGLVSALISAVMVIGTFSKLGLDMAIIRFLPMEQDRTGIINSCLNITFIASVMGMIILRFFEISPYVLLLKMPCNKGRLKSRLETSRVVMG